MALNPIFRYIDDQEVEVNFFFLFPACMSGIYAETYKILAIRIENKLF